MHLGHDVLDAHLHVASGRAADGHGEAMRGRRPALRELPGLGLIVNLAREGDGRRLRRRQREGEVGERQRQAHAARLDVRLLQGPVVEEHALLIGGRQRSQIGDLARREEAIGDVVGERAVHPLDVHAHVPGGGDRAGDQAVGVRHVEPHGPRARWLDQFGPSVFVGDEPPLPGIAAQEARQLQPRQRAADDEPLLVGVEVEPCLARHFLGDSAAGDSRPAVPAPPDHPGGR